VIDEVLFDQHVHHAERQRAVGADRSASRIFISSYASDEHVVRSRQDAPSLREKSVSGAAHRVEPAVGVAGAVDIRRQRTQSKFRIPFDDVAQPPDASL
jgi:hypothetical protein